MPPLPLSLETSLKSSGAWATMPTGNTMSPLSPSFSASERSPAHSWHSPALRPRTHACSREQVRAVQTLTRRPHSASGIHGRGDEDGSGSQSPSKKSAERWSTGELAPHCRKMVSDDRPRNDPVGSAGLENNGSGEQRFGSTGPTGLENSAGELRLEPCFYQRAGRCTMEADQPPLRHYVKYGRFQGDPFFYKGKRDSRFTRDVFNIPSSSLTAAVTSSLTNLSVLRRMPRNPNQNRIRAV